MKAERAPNSPYVTVEHVLRIMGLYMVVTPRLVGPNAPVSRSQIFPASPDLPVQYSRSTVTSTAT